MQITEELKNLFNTVRVRLGAPIRAVQLDDNQLCALLEIAVGDYAEKVLNWVTYSKWLDVYGKNLTTLTAQDLAFALTTRTMDFTKDFSYWFSKEVGLQQRGSFELKKDFVTVERGKQCYLIPAGREINKVLYVTPSTTKAAVYGNMGTLDSGFGGNMGQYGNMGNGLGTQGFYVGSAYDSALLSVDLKYKNSLLRGDLAYKVTAGPEGTHILHLLSVPGSPNVMGSTSIDDNWGWNKYSQCYVWYTYYDTNGASGDEIEACRMENKDDILLTPDQVPFDKMRYELMNEPTQQTIRQLLVGEAAMTLGLIRGTFSGNVSIPNAQLTMDYQMLIEFGRQEKERALNDLKERLEGMLPWNMIKNMSNMTDDLMNIMKQKPLPFYFR